MSLKTCLKWKFAPVIFFFENCTFLTAICSSTQFHPLPTAFQTHVAEMPPKYTYIFISCLSINSTHGNVYLHLWLELLICKSKYNVSKNLDEWAFQIQAHNIKDPCIHNFKQQQAKVFWLPNIILSKSESLYEYDYCPC